MGCAREFTKGLIRENPSLVLLLGLCPSLAVTTSLDKALGMGLAATFVLFFSNLFVSLLRKAIPDEIRIPAYIVIIATFVTVVKLVMAAYFPALKESLGIFLALIVVNCIILARAEAFAAKNGPVLSMADGLGMGLGFTGALCLIGGIREILGGGSLYGIPLAEGLEPYSQNIMILPAGGFLTMGCLLGLINHIRNRGSRRPR
jgi:electron transport complex protein RnfE